MRSLVRTLCAAAVAGMLVALAVCWAVGVFDDLPRDPSTPSTEAVDELIETEVGG